MPTPDATLSGSFAVGGDMVVHRLGFGAMRITGSGIWGPPSDPDECRRTLRRVRDLGIDFIDTAEAYGPYLSEEMLAEVLFPYGGIVVATKGGHTRTGPNAWVQIGRAEFITQGVKLSLRRLKLEQHPLWQLHRIDPKTPKAETFGTIAELQKQGLIRHAGLSEVSVAEIKEAPTYFPVASVQNKYSITDRKSEDVLAYCEANNIAFIPWRPIDGGAATGGAAFQALMKKYGASATQLGLAWLLKRSPVMLPIPGNSRVAHLEENTAAAAIQLSDADFAAIDALGR
jgi:aryl-alcohol dehydrogenase-like predicted oxidoreductase